MSSDPPRSLGLEGASNFRDLGGYRGHDNARVAWRRLYRSDHLGALTPPDMARLSALGLARVVDFRGVSERMLAPCVQPGVVVHSLPIEPTVVARLRRLREELLAGQRVTPLDEADAVAMMQETYRDFVRLNTPRFAALFARLLEGDAPLVFHCTAGKDRTGLAAALLLAALGVSRDDIEQDYLLSNALFKVRDAPAIPSEAVLPPPVRDVLNRVQLDFLHHAFTVIDHDWGGLPRYVAQGLGLDAASLDQLRYRYLG